MHEFLRSRADRLPFRDKSFDLVMGSPPYLQRRTYGIDAGRELRTWVRWMVRCTEEGLRVSKGLVIWVCMGEGSSDYRPGPEGLIYEMSLLGHRVLLPNIWISNKPPSGRKWFTNNYEYVLAFGNPDHYFSVEGLRTKMKYQDGGRFRQRRPDGTRVLGSAYPTHSHRKTIPNQFYEEIPEDELCDVPATYRVPVGGGLMGHPSATMNEAPYPIGVPRRFVEVCSPPGGWVLDPFSGSGTTVHASWESGRHGIGTDLRLSQCRLGRDRMKDPTIKGKRQPTLMDALNKNRNEKST